MMLRDDTDTYLLSYPYSIGRTPIIIPEDADINRIVDTIVTTRKQNPTAESVESLWSILDANDDGKVK